MKSIKDYLKDNDMGAAELGKLLGYGRSTINERKRKKWTMEAAQGGFNFVNPRKPKAKIFEAVKDEHI